MFTCHLSIEPAQRAASQQLGPAPADAKRFVRVGLISARPLAASPRRERSGLDRGARAARAHGPVQVGRRVPGDAGYCSAMSRRGNSPAGPRCRGPRPAAGSSGHQPDERDVNFRIAEGRRPSQSRTAVTSPSAKRRLPALASPQLTQGGSDRLAGCGAASSAPARRGVALFLPEPSRRVRLGIHAATRAVTIPATAGELAQVATGRRARVDARHDRHEEVLHARAALRPEGRAPSRRSCRAVARQPAPGSAA